MSGKLKLYVSYGPMLTAYCNIILFIVEYTTNIILFIVEYSIQAQKPSRIIAICIVFLRLCQNEGYHYLDVALLGRSVKNVNRRRIFEIDSFKLFVY